MSSSRSLRTFLRNSSALLSIAYDNGRSYPVAFRVRHNNIVGISSLGGQTLQQHYVKKKSGASLVIFDKDGTLICFNSLWVPWAYSIAKSINEVSGLEIEEEIYELLGFCSTEERVRPGLLAEGTLSQIHEALVRALISRGFSSESAIWFVDKAIQIATDTTAHQIREIYNLNELFTTLRRNGIKIAICTSDSRRGTLNALKKLNVEKLVDAVVCGDDPGGMPKPHPHNALSICRLLDVDPPDTIMVGDTLADMGMGRSANLGSVVGVLSGICSSEQLRPLADHIINDISEVLPIILDMRKFSLS